jgi:hypothetical protein
MAWNRYSQPLPPPPVLLTVPRALENLLAIPAVQPISAKSSEVQPAPAKNADATQAAAGGNKPQKVIKAATPIETTLADVPQREKESRARAGRGATNNRAKPDARPSEPEKGFWGKLNPIHGKTNPFKKRQGDSASRSPVEPAPEDRLQ